MSERKPASDDRQPPKKPGKFHYNPVNMSGRETEIAERKDDNDNTADNDGARRQSKQALPTGKKSHERDR